MNTPSDIADLSTLGLDNFPPYLMNRIMGRYNAALGDELSKAGLTTPQFRALAVLSVNDDILVGELAIYAVVVPSTLSRALDTLERDGLIKRQADSTDGRAFKVTITPAGRAVYARLWPQMAAASEAMFPGIPETERIAFTGTLQKILHNIRKHDF